MDNELGHVHFRLDFAIWQKTFLEDGTLNSAKGKDRFDHFLINYFHFLVVNAQVSNKLDSLLKFFAAIFRREDLASGKLLNHFEGAFVRTGLGSFSAHLKQFILLLKLFIEKWQIIFTFSFN